MQKSVNDNHIKKTYLLDTVSSKRKWNNKGLKPKPIEFINQISSSKSTLRRKSVTKPQYDIGSPFINNDSNINVYRVLLNIVNLIEELCHMLKGIIQY